METIDHAKLRRNSTLTMRLYLIDRLAYVARKVKMCCKLTDIAGTFSMNDVPTVTQRFPLRASCPLVQW